MTNTEHPALTALRRIVSYVKEAQPEGYISKQAKAAIPALEATLAEHAAFPDVVENARRFMGQRDELLAALTELLEWVEDNHENECWLDTDSADDENPDGQWRAYSDLPQVDKARTAIDKTKGEA